MRWQTALGLNLLFVSPCLRPVALVPLSRGLAAGSLPGGIYCRPSLRRHGKSINRELMNVNPQLMQRAIKKPPYGRRQGIVGKLLADALPAFTLHAAVKDESGLHQIWSSERLGPALTMVLI